MNLAVFILLWLAHSLIDVSIPFSTNGRNLFRFKIFQEILSLPWIGIRRWLLKFPKLIPLESNWSQTSSEASLGLKFWAKKVPRNVFENSLAYAAYGMPQSCKIVSKLNWVICEIATPSKNPIGLFTITKLRRVFPMVILSEFQLICSNKNSKIKIRNFRNYRNSFYNSGMRHTVCIRMDHKKLGWI